MPRNTRDDVFQYIDMRQGPDACWPWHGPVGGRVGEQRPYFQANLRRQLAYRIVYELTYGVALTPDQKLLHSCDNGSMPIGCCNPRHLRIGTVQDNSDDMMKRERHGMPKHAVTAIRKLYAQGRTQQVIADLYGISQENVSAIVTGKTYNYDEGQTRLEPSNEATINQGTNQTPETEQ